MKRPASTMKPAPDATNSILIPDDSAAPRRPILHDRCPLVVLYVSTDLHVIWMRGEVAQVYARDLRQRDDDRTRIYRRLDLVYFVWLSDQMAAAEHAFTAGRISASTIEKAREQFAPCRTWVKIYFTAQQLLVACHNGAAAYVPPRRQSVAA